MLVEDGRTVFHHISFQGFAKRFVVNVVPDGEGDHPEDRDSADGDHSRVSLETFTKMTESGFVHLFDKPLLRVPLLVNPLNAMVNLIELVLEHDLVNFILVDNLLESFRIFVICLMVFDILFGKSLYFIEHIGLILFKFVQIVLLSLCEICGASHVCHVLHLSRLLAQAKVVLDVEGRHRGADVGQSDNCHCRCENIHSHIFSFSLLTLVK